MGLAVQIFTCTQTNPTGMLGAELVQVNVGPVCVAVCAQSVPRTRFQLSLLCTNGPPRLSRSSSSAHCEPSGVQSGRERWSGGRSQCQLSSVLSEVLCHIPPPAVPAGAQ